MAVSEVVVSLLMAGRWLCLIHVASAQMALPASVLRWQQSKKGQTSLDQILQYHNADQVKGNWLSSPHHHLKEMLLLAQFRQSGAVLVGQEHVLNVLLIRIPRSSANL